MSKAEELWSIEQERHTARTMLVNGQITGLQALRRFFELDQWEEAVNKRAFAVYMRILGQEQDKKAARAAGKPATKLTKEQEFALRQQEQRNELMAELKAKLAKMGA